MLSRVLLLFGLCVGVCWSARPYDIIDVSNYSLPDDFFPENDRDVVLPQRRFLSPTSPSSRSSKEKQTFLKKVTKGKDNLQNLLRNAKQMHYDKTDKIEAYILKSAHIFSKISSSATDTVVSLQKPTRRFFLKSILNLPSVACDATDLMIQKLLPDNISPMSIKTQFILNPTGNSTDGNKTESKTGGAPAGGAKTDAGKKPAGGAKPAVPAKKPRNMFRLLYRRTFRNHGEKMKQKAKSYYKFLKKIQMKFKHASGAILKKIRNALHRYGRSKRKLTNKDKQKFNSAFMAIAKLSKDATTQVMSLPSRRFGLAYINNVLSNAMKSCRSKADLIASIVPTNFEFKSKVKL